MSYQLNFGTVLGFIFSALLCGCACEHVTVPPTPSLAATFADETCNKKSLKHIQFKDLAAWPSDYAMREIEILAKDAECSNYHVDSQEGTLEGVIPNYVDSLAFRCRREVAGVLERDEHWPSKDQSITLISVKTEVKARCLEVLSADPEPTFQNWVSRL